jgi:hypothetical protein
MKVMITVVDDQGTKFRGELILLQDGSMEPVNSVAFKSMVPEPVTSEADPDYSLNPRNFARTYGGGMSGEQLFTLLLALETRGTPGKEVAGAAIEKRWASMTGVLRLPFNRRVTTRAKEYGWVDSRNRGSYSLTTNWKEIFAKMRKAE